MPSFLLGGRLSRCDTFSWACSWPILSSNLLWFFWSTVLHLVGGTRHPTDFRKRERWLCWTAEWREEITLARKPKYECAGVKDDTSSGPISAGSFPRPPTSFNSWSTWLASTQQTCFKSLAPFGSPNLRLTNSFKIPINNSAVNHNSEVRFPFSHALAHLERAQVIIKASPVLVVHANLERRPPGLLAPRNATW